MYQTYDDLPDGEIRKRIAQYRYDYFFHYLLMESERIRLTLCRFLSGDNTIRQTFLETNESYIPYYGGKKLIMDQVVRDDKGRFYNFEMQNYDIEDDDEVRFACYLNNMMERQLKRGVDYIDMKDVYQLVLYTGNPVENFHHYQHNLKRGDFEYGAVLEHQKAHAVLLQLQLMEEDLNMEVSLTAINQLAYLFMNGKSHENSETVEDVKDAKDIHNKYMNTDEVIKGYELERERLIIQTKMNKARREGELKGELKERYKNVLELIDLIYGGVDTRWVESCSFEQLSHAYTLVKKCQSYEEFKVEMLK